MPGANAVGSSHVRLTPEGSRRIRVYRNGDAHFKGITIVLNTRQVHNIDALLDMISEKIGLVMGCKRLFTLDGTPMKSMEQLQHNMEYVAASGAFIPVRYGRVGSASGSMLTRSSSNFSAASREDPLAQSGASKQSAPASLTSGAHAPLRPSRSIEPRRMVVGRPPPSAPMNGPTSRKKAEERSKKGGDGKKARDGSKKRKASKKKAEANDEQLLLSDDPPAPVEAAAPEAQEEQQNENHQLQSQPEEEEAEEEEGKAEADEEQPPARRRTEVEVVEHHEEEEEDGEQQQQHQETDEGRVATPGSSRSPRAPTAETEEDEEEAEEETPEAKEGEEKREGGQ
uniref:Doublecortin domain-containing protein n=1 Tax=Globodera pallida TaxID=36090 RepID=A0A183CE36_GLOPA